MKIARLTHLTCLLAAVVGFSTLATSAQAQITVDFEDLTLAPESFYNGSPAPGADFTSQGVTFPNTYTVSPPFEFWGGWSYSNTTDTTTPGFGNQYSAYAGSGSGGSANYGITFGSFGNAVEIPTGYTFQSIDITNTTYAALSMENGDAFAKQFGGITGDDPDFFTLTIEGRSGGAAGAVVGTVDFALADYTFADNSMDYIVDTWETVDLSSLVGADTLTFSYASSDVGGFGINTPTYFAADNLQLSAPTVPEPSSIFGAFIGLIAAVLGYRVIGRRRRELVA